MKLREKKVSYNFFHRFIEQVFLADNPVFSCILKKFAELLYGYPTSLGAITTKSCYLEPMKWVSLFYIFLRKPC